MGRCVFRPPPKGKKGQKRGRYTLNILIRTTQFLSYETEKLNTDSRPCAGRPGGVRAAEQVRSQSGVQSSGAGYTIGETAFKDLISPAGALSLGYQFNPTLGLRFNVAGYQGKGNVVAPLEVYKFNYLQGAFDLTLNLAQLLGYKHDRVFNPFVFLGGGVAYGFKNGANNITKTNPKEYFAYLWEKNMVTPVARVGLGADFRLSDAVALTLEVNENVLSDKFNSKKVGHPDFQFNALAGLKINFAERQVPRRARRRGGCRRR